MACTSENACEWVNEIVSASLHEPLATDAIWKSLDLYAGRGAGAPARLRDVLDYISVQLAEHAEDPAERPLAGLWVRVADYLRVRERRAA